MLLVGLLVVVVVVVFLALRDDRWQRRDDFEKKERMTPRRDSVFLALRGGEEVLQSDGECLCKLLREEEEAVLCCQEAASAFFEAKLRLGRIPKPFSFSSIFFFLLWWPGGILVDVLLNYSE